MEVLVLESSTSAAKAMVYDFNDSNVEILSEPYTPDIGMGGLLDARKVYLATMRLGRKLAEGRNIRAIAVCGVWHSILACDETMSPVLPVYLWNFTGTGGISRKIRNNKELAREIYRNTGCMPNITYQPYALMHMSEHGLDLRDKYFASQAGYHFLRLTGKRRETRSIVSGMGFLNIHRLEYDETIMDLCSVRSEQFGELVDYRATAPLNEEGAELLGLPIGIPVVPPHSDGALNQLGNNAIGPDTMTFSVGTSAALRLSTDRPVLSDPPNTWCYVGVENRISGAATNGACNCIDWVKRTLLANRWSFEELENAFSDDHLDDAEKSPLFLPFLYGERCPGWNDLRRGGFRNLDGVCDVYALFRAVAEGVLFNIYQCYEILTQFSGTPKKTILSGGILNSNGWTRMAADIFQQELILSPNPHASLLGGAAPALCAAGAIGHPGEFSFRETPTDSGESEVEPRTVLPRREFADRYREKFERYLEHYRNENADAGL